MDGIVLRSEKTEITYMSRFILGEVDMLRRGDWAVAVGCDFEFASVSAFLRLFR
jgi:hypothetical protein